MDIRLVLTFGAAALFLAGCGGDSPSEPPDPVPTSLTITGHGGPLTYIGATVQLGATIRDQNGVAMSGGSVTWTTSDAGVATVSGSGLVTSKGRGTTTVTARAGSAQANVQVEVEPQPSSIVVASGDAQSGTVGRMLLDAVSVEVKDAGGHGVEAIDVTFAIVGGGGSVASASGTTDADGRASTNWVLGTSTAEDQRLRVTAGSTSVEVLAEALPDAPVAADHYNGDLQTGLAGEELADDLALRVVDQYGNGVPQVAVEWVVEPEDGSFVNTSDVTDDMGVARARWLLEAHAGEKRASAAVEGLGEIQFTATATPNGVIAGTVVRAGGFWTPPPSPVLEARGVSPKIAQVGPVAPRTLAPGDATYSGPEFVGRELIVKFRPSALQAVGVPGGVPRSVSAAAVQEQGLLSQADRLITTTDLQAVRATGVLKTVLVRVGGQGPLDGVIEEIRADPSVEWVERNRWVHGAGYGESGARSPETIGEFNPAWGLESKVARNVIANDNPAHEPLYPWQAWHYELLDLPQAWKITKGDPSIIVAVVDDGARFDHPDLTDNLTSDGYDFVSGGVEYPVCGTGTYTDFAGDGDGRDSDPTTPFVVRFDYDFECIYDVPELGGHGLHVAGTVAAAENAWGGVGAAPGVQVRPIRVLGVHGAGTTLDIADGILYAAGLPVSGQQADGPAHVINLSLGGAIPSLIQQEAIQQAYQAGSLIVAAAGNEGTSTPRYPAAFAEAMAVSAVGPGAIFADSYSNWGSHVDLAAPGGDLTRGLTPEWGVVSSYWDFSSGSPAFHGIQGTSMAAPHVSGVAALLFSQDPSRTNDQVRSLITSYASDLSPAGRDDWSGYGLVNALDALTGGQGIPGDTRVQLRDATTGALLEEQVAVGGQFRFEGLADGAYHVFAGVDEFSDGIVGATARPWGALGGSATPTSIVVDGAAEHGASFNFGFPAESTNDTPGDADALPVGGYMNASLDTGSDQDYYVVRIAEAGTYTFETSNLWSACGFPMGADTVIDLLDDAGVLLGSNDDIDTDARLHCSRLSLQLQPGTYLLRVSPWDMRDSSAGYYRVSVRD